MESAKISRSLLKRLPLYLEYLQNLPEETVSSATIAAALGHIAPTTDDDLS